MTERKPAGMTPGDWIDAQIREAQERGLFDDLPGAGKPIPDLLAPDTELDYVAKVVRREGLEVTAFLPPALALAKEVEDLPERLRSVRSEAGVREVVEDLNARIVKAIRAPQQGPPVRVRQVDVDEVVAAWWATRKAPEPIVPPTVVQAAPRRRWRLRPGRTGRGS